VGAGDVRDLLNARYAAGRPSNILAEAGVLVHVMDGGLQRAEPWRGGNQGFLSASLLNSRKLPNALYTKGTALVLSPRSRLVCSYPQDSGTKSWTVPKVPVAGCGPHMCTDNDAPFPPPRSGAGYVCAFPPTKLRDALEIFEAAPVSLSAYTEIVISTAPGEFAIEAVVCDSTCDYYRAGRDDESHANLLRHFGLSATQLPLLRWGPGLKGVGPLFVS